MTSDWKQRKKQFRYFLEVFNPNVDPGIEAEKIGGFLNDCIIRCLAGVTRAGRPVFLKIPYNGPGPLEELASYDSSLVVGILGGSSGTTLDAFQLIHDAQKYGARVALFGRKINLSEHPLAFIESSAASPTATSAQSKPSAPTMASCKCWGFHRCGPSRTISC